MRSNCCGARVLTEGEGTFYVCSSCHEPCDEEAAAEALEEAKGEYEYIRQLEEEAREKAEAEKQEAEKILIEAMLDRKAISKAAKKS